MQNSNNRKLTLGRVLLKLAIPMLLLAFMFLLSACGGDVTPGPDETTQPVEEEVTPININLKEYVILRAEEGEVYPSKIALALQTAFSSAMGADVEIITDFAKLYPNITEKEIVVGPTNREGSVYTSTVTTLPDAGKYEIEQLGERILLHFSDVFGAAAAGEALIKSVVPAENRDKAIEVYNKMLDQANILGTAVKFKSIFDDNMMIQQNKPFTVTGTCTAMYGEYSAQLLAGDEILQTVPLVVNEETGTFTADFEGVVGSYRAHSIRVVGGDRKLAEIENVIFGELWIATGQSNMAYTLAKEVNFPDSFTKDEYIRIMQVGRPDGGYLAEPISETNKINWIVGDSQSAVSGVSAVGYYFCQKLRENLGVPVGMIFYAVGGTPVRSWISRETINATPELLADKKYAVPEAWDTAGYRQPTALYNSMVAPSLGLPVAGLLWYQGEQDLGERAANYTKELETMYLQYCRDYGFADYEMPFIMPIIAPYLAKSAPQFYAQFTANLSEWAAEQKLVAALPINDVTPEHMPDNNASHPMTKLPVGQRLASSAMAMVYGERGITADAPHAKSISVSGDVLTVTFENVADGLTIVGDSTVLRGFMLCGADGVYYPATAEIVGKDQVALTSPSVPNPVSATYAYELLTYTANLGCTRRGELLYMASPFAFDMPANAKTLTQISFADFDLSNIWHLTRDTNHWAVHYDAWTAKQGSKALNLVYSKTGMKYQGDASLRVTVPAAGAFTLSPTLVGINDENAPVVLYDFNTDYTRFGKVSIMIKNEGSKELTVTGLKMGSYTAPADITSIPAKSDWTKVTFDLSKATGLAKVNVIQIMLTANGSGNVFFDDMQFLK